MPLFTKQRFSILAILAPLIYFFSSGPVLATAFLLREATGNDVFYNVMWAYYPLLTLIPRAIWDPYISWWVKLFGTVGPG